jgi:hypothetical protein
LRRMLKILGGLTELGSPAWGRRRLRRRSGLQRQMVSKLDDAPPNGNRGNKKEDRCCEKRDAIAMSLNPGDCLLHS